MTRAEFDALIANASPSVKSSARTALKESYEDQARHKTSSPKPQRAVRDDALAAPQGEGKDSGRVSIVITSYRRRLTDPDNLCGKYFVDLLRYAGLIRDDREEDISYQITQRKIRSKEEERTEIEIETP